MIIVMGPGAGETQVQAVIDRIQTAGLSTHVSIGVARTVIGVVGDDRTKEMLRESLEVAPGVEKVVAILQPFKLVSREFISHDTVVDVGTTTVGGDRLAVMAGPCSVESREQILAAAGAVRAAGGTILRGGAFKPRTSPYSFQGLEEDGLKLLAEARARTNLPIVTEAMDASQLEMVCRYADMIQIGARNMQNYPLLREAGRARLPVLLKRGVSATLEELLLAAEYILSEGNYRVVLCERGIRGFNGHTRYTLDLSAVPVLKGLTHLPVVVDPSHGTGKSKYVPSMAKAAVAAGADGLMVEIHPDPANALSDGPQSLNFENFADLMTSLRPVAAAVGRAL
jgi:3-deoxy-7-phosphoheptulonate synthase